MMVDPDGTLDALSSMGLTSPVSDPKTSPGAQQGAPLSHTGAQISSKLSAAKVEEFSGEPCGSSKHAEETKNPHKGV